MDKIDISFIVPVYNSEPYIIRCLKSICNQNSANFEIIIINDGSTDKTGHLIKSFLETNNSTQNIKYIDKENEGVSEARNCGLKLAKGEYIAFVDSDDFISSNYISSVTKIMNKAPDVIRFDYALIENGNITEIKEEETNQYQTEDILCDESGNQIWRNIYKKSVVEGIYFSNMQMYEDLDWIYKILCVVKSICYVHDCLYNYCIRKDSLSYSNKKSSTSYNGFIVFHKRLEYAKSINNKRCIDILMNKTAYFATSTIIYFNKKTEEYKEAKAFLKSNKKQIHKTLRFLFAYYCNGLYKYIKRIKNK